MHTLCPALSGAQTGKLRRSGPSAGRGPRVLPRPVWASDPSLPPSPGTGADPAVSAKSNHCLDAAKACNLNDNCKKLRSSYISICNREISPTERCNRRKCHKALRQFFDRVPSEYTYRMLFCSCQDQACAERRRQTILPSCSYEDKEKPNCLDLRSVCRTDHLCR